MLLPSCRLARGTACPPPCDAAMRHLRHAPPEHVSAGRFTRDAAERRLQRRVEVLRLRSRVEVCCLKPVASMLLTRCVATHRATLIGTWGGNPGRLGWFVAAVWNCFLPGALWASELSVGCGLHGGWSATHSC